MKQPITIVLTGGGSGGHITPLLSLARALKKANPSCRLVYIGLRGDALTAALKERLRVFDEIRLVPAGKFRRYHDQGLLAHLLDVRSLALNARDFFRVLVGIGSAYKILKQIKPAAVFSKGGFVVVPVGIAAYIQRIPIVTHDSDATAGLANRIVGRFAKIHATGLPPEYYNYPKESVRYVGVPIDERIEPVTAQLLKDFKKKLGLSADSQLLLIGGAGLGARDVNNMVLKISAKLLEQFTQLHIIHLSGYAHETEIKQAYQEQLGDAAARVRVLSFTPDFYIYTGAADLIITRAGATTIAEAAAQRKAVILIPAPQLTGGHQLKNAEILRQKQAVEVVPNDAEPQLLFDAIARLLNNPEKRRQLSQKLGLLSKTDTADRLAELLLGLVAKNKTAE